MKAVTKRVLEFSEEEREAAACVKSMCKEVCDVFNYQCQYCPLNDCCDSINAFCRKVENDGYITAEVEH